jgi:hypothetical protein
MGNDMLDSTAPNTIANETAKPKRSLDRSGRLSGAARQAELAREAEAERVAEVGRIIADMGCTPTRVQALLVDELAALAVKARRLRRQGKSTDEVTMLMTRVAGRLGIKAGSKSSGPTLAQYLATKAAASPVAPSPSAATSGTGGRKTHR